jgi:rubrerythrin
MTREEVIEYMNTLYMALAVFPNQQISLGNVDEMKESVSMAIKALEQELCEDAISRQAVLEIQTKYAEHIGATKFWQMRDDIKALPSVTPQPKIGRWIADVDRWGDIVTTVNGYRCSECNAFNTDKDNFCPNCGAKMLEPQESEVRDAK